MDIRYLAGFFDGEGTIRFKPTKGSPAVQLQIPQKREEVLYVIKDNFGGWIESGGKSCRRWVLRGKKAELLAREMLPYLVVKRQDVVELLNNKEVNNGR